MEQSKLISGVIAKLKIAFPYYFKELKTEELAGMIAMYQEELGGYNELTLSTAVKSIIRKNKFMPTLKELLDECEQSKTFRGNAILEVMKNDGYFKRGVEELSDQHATRNYEKALSWLENGIIPNWLLEDMKKYGYVEDKPLLSQNSCNYIEMKG